MEHYPGKIDTALQQALDTLAHDDVSDALIYPERLDKDLLAFLAQRKAEGVLQYNVLHLAHCIAVKAPKNVLLAIAARRDVTRLSANPRFTAHTS